MGKIRGVIYIATVPDESPGRAMWVRRVLGLTLSLLHKSEEGNSGISCKITVLLNHTVPLAVQI